jgi:hypothetical protein
MSNGGSQFDPARNLIELGGRRIVFHCHHYNLFLQRTIEDALGPQAAAELQIAAGCESARELLTRVLAVAGALSMPDKLTRAGELFAAHGFGLADLRALHASGGRVTLPTSHYALGWRAKWGTSRHPVCYFALGYWQGALAAAAGIAPERLVGHEVQCAATGAAACELSIEVR